jgi:hypothetical protein
MKLKHFFILIFFVKVFQANAQIESTTMKPLGYGIKGGTNLAIIGNGATEYNSLVGLNLSVFFNKPLTNRLSLYVDPGVSSARFQSSVNDTRFNNYYLEANTYLNFYPSAYNTDFSIVFGVRPSLLVAYNSQVFEIGNYVNRTLGINRNKSGSLDAAATIGLNIALSPVVNLELLYNHSFTNENTNTQVLGRPSSIDIGLRLNAVSLKKVLDNKAASTEEQVRNYKRGVLLVMLVTPNSKEIEKLNMLGKTKEASMIVNDIRVRNAKVIKEFTSNFSFCPVYFFMDTSVYKVIAGSTQGIFVNSSMELDTSINVTNPNGYFVASFCEDVSEYTKRRHFGLFVYDAQMNQLSKPFNHPNQLASPVFDYVVVNNIENKTRKPSYTTVPFEKLINKFNTRLFRYITN